MSSRVVSNVTPCSPFRDRFTKPPIQETNDENAPALLYLNKGMAKKCGDHFLQIFALLFSGRCGAEVVLALEKETSEPTSGEQPPPIVSVRDIPLPNLVKHLRVVERELTRTTSCCADNRRNSLRLSSHGNFSTTKANRGKTPSNPHRSIHLRPIKEDSRGGHVFLQMKKRKEAV